MTLRASALVYSLFTDYELGLMRYLSIQIHLWLDVLFAVAMLLAPRLLDFPDDTRWPNYAIGLFGLIIVAITDTSADGNKHGHQDRHR